MQVRHNRPGYSTRYEGVMVTGIPVDGIPALWLRVEPMLKPALGQGETTGEVLTKIYRQEAQLWCVFNEGDPIAAIVTEIVTEDDGRKVCNIWAAGGTGINMWFDYLEMLEEWAAENGCAAIGIEHARPGWKRLMKGYKVTHVSLEKEL